MCADVPNHKAGPDRAVIIDKPQHLRDILSHLCLVQTHKELQSFNMAVYRNQISKGFNIFDILKHM